MGIARSPRTCQEISFRVGKIRVAIPHLRYTETTNGFRIEFGRFTLNQSTFLLLAAVIVGLGGGYGAVLFRWLIRMEGRLAFGWLAPHLGFLARLNVVPVLVAGGIATAFIVERFAKEAKGHGVPGVMEAVALRGGVMRPRVIAVKSFASATCIGFGGSCGREGPIVQIGSTIGSVLGQLVQAPASVIRTLVACGAAAGISATFNAPIGGVFFASEIILGDFAPRSFATIVVASVVAAVIGRAYFGNHPSFTASVFQLVSPGELALYALLGVIAAFWAAGFVKLLYFLEDTFEAWHVGPLLKAALGFGMVGVIGIWFPEIFGVGYGNINAVLARHVPALHGLLLATLKPIATSLTLGSGGIFAPSLYTGAMLGDAFGSVAHQAFPSWTAAAAEAPITSIMIVFEMSNDYTIVLPLMIATVIATILSRRLQGYTIYEMKLIRRGIDWMRVRRPGLFTRIRVRAVQRQPVVIAHAYETIRAVAVRLRDTDEYVIPVVEAGRFLGMVTASDIAAHVVEDPSGSTLIHTLVRPATATLSPRDTLEQAALMMAEPTVALLPVVDDATGKLQGIVTRRDVLGAYRSAAEA